LHLRIVIKMAQGQIGPTQSSSLLALLIAVAGCVNADLAGGGQFHGTLAPRAELHVHLDGAIPVDVLWKVCLWRRIELEPGAGLPASPAAVLDHLFQQPQPWQRFDIVNDIIGGSAAVIQNVSEEFVAFQARSGVMYTEVRYDPIRLARSKFARSELSLEEAVHAVQQGLAAGAARHRVAAYQILCAMRGKSSEQCFEVANLTKRMQSSAIGGVVAMDLAGDEVSYPNAPYVSCFKHAKLNLGLKITVHAGEFNLSMAGDVKSAILQMGADRIGHGYAAANDAKLVALANERNIHFEFCPNSALRHGLPLLEAMGVLKGHGVNFGLNTDDPADWIGNTTAAKDEAIVQTELGFNTSDIAGAYRAALSAAFGPAAQLLASHVDKGVDACSICKVVVGGLSLGEAGTPPACREYCAALVVI